MQWIKKAGGRTRTPDLLITNQLLYQLSYTSVSTIFIISYFKQLVKPFFELFRHSRSLELLSLSTDLFIISHCFVFVKRFLKFFQIFLFSSESRGDRTRTCGILVPNQALYQTELRLVNALLLYHAFSFLSSFFSKKL